MSPLYQSFSECISPKLLLRRTGREWKIRNEKEKTDVSLKVDNRASVGFSVEGNQSKKPFAFFSGNPLEGVAKMCDGIIVCSDDDKDYIFVVELKSAHKGDYKKQITNGRHFCEWMVTLLKEHGHYDREVVYIGVLCYSPRDEMNRERPRYLRKEDLNGFMSVYHCDNLETVHLTKLIDD